MRRKISILILTLISLSGLFGVAPAQEAVSSETGSSGTSSGSASSSAGSTTDLSSGTPSNAVSNAPTAASSVTGGPSTVGVFSPTPIAIFANLFGGYDTNVNTNVGPEQASSYAGGNVILDYTFGDPRLEIALNAGAGGVFYLESVAGQDYDIDLKGAVGVKYKASPRLTLGTTLLLDYLTEPNFDNPGGLNSRNGNYLYTTDNFFATYAWSRRFSTRTAYTFEAYKYDDNAIGVFSDRTSHIFGNEFQFQMVPTTKLLAEYRYGIVTYDNEGAIIIPAVFDIFGNLIFPPVTLQNNSTTHFVLGGIEHIFNPRFSGSIRGGVQFRSYDAGGDRSGPYFEGNLTYAVGRRTTVSWNTRYGIEEPEIPGAQSRTTLRTGLHAKFDLASRVSSTFDAFYVHDDYHSLTTVAVAPIAAFSQDVFDVGLGIRYAVTPLVGVQASYHYTDITSDVAGREYSRNRFSGGLTVSF